MKSSRVSLTGTTFLLSLSLVSWAATPAISAEPVVPGTGTRVAYDDLEDPSWSYELNLPKASSNIDNQERQPGGSSSNAKWYESSLRGEPDIIKRVPTPPGGLPGSHGALLMRTLNSGVPYYHTNKFQQDDLVFNASMTTGGYISPSRTPNAIVRVYLPPFDQWEKRTGSSLGIRADVIGTFHKNGAQPRLLPPAGQHQRRAFLARFLHPVQQQDRRPEPAGLGHDPGPGERIRSGHPRHAGHADRLVDASA